MRYLFVSDIHGQYDKLILALANANFDMDNDTLVSVGDPFDRGPQSKEVLEFFLSCPHRIMLWGNHDFRLRQLVLQQDYYNECDAHNGVPATLKSLVGTDGSIWARLIKLQTHADLWQYFRECHCALEFKNLIVTHAWLPYNVWRKNGVRTYILRQDWRNICHLIEWEDAFWADTAALIKANQFPDKPLLIGHWWAHDLAKICGEKRDPEDNSMFISADGKLIAIDGLTNLPEGQVNVFEYFSDEEPIIYG